MGANAPGIDNGDFLGCLYNNPSIRVILDLVKYQTIKHAANMSNFSIIALKILPGNPTNIRKILSKEERW